MVEPGTLSQLAFEQLAQLCHSHHTMEMLCQYSSDLCSLIHLYHYNITNSYFYLFCLCDWDCFFLDVLLSIHVSIFSTRSPYIVVHIFAFVFAISLSLSFYISLSSSIDLNRRLQWNLLCPHLHQESCLLVLIRLTKCFLQSKLISIYQLIWISNSISSSLL